LQKENTVDACQKTLDIHIVREHIISLLEETENTNAILTRDRKVEQNLLHDLEIFQTYDHAHMSTLSHAFKKGTRLSASSFYIETLLRHYAAGADQVYQRQRVLQTLFRKHNRIDIILERLATNEEALAWMIECKQHQTDKHSLHDIAFLQNHLLQWLNRNGTFLTAYNI